MRANINTLEYWDGRFNDNWEENSGFAQTVFFAQVACQIIPKDIKNDITSRKLSICDAGCACGQGVEVLRSYFDTPVSGVDFSAQAIYTAKELFPHNEYYVADITKPLDISYGVVFCSNVLEHLDNPWDTAAALGSSATDYLLVLIPFREFPGECREHLHQFENSDIPLSLNDLHLSHAIAVNTGRWEHTLYSGKQILLVYSPEKMAVGNLGNLSNSLEALACEIENYDLRERLANLQNEYDRQNKELHKSSIEIEQQINTADRLSSLILLQETTIENQTEILADQNRVIAEKTAHEEELCAKVLSLQKDRELDKRKLAELHSSRSWRIGRAVTALPRRIKRTLSR